MKNNKLHDPGRSNSKRALNYEAVIFDLDGVITDTAKVHALTWKVMLDDYLERRSIKYKEDFYPFIIEKDYPTYVDGKPRYDGIRSFLQSRGIMIAYGDSNDSPEQETVCGLSNRKNRIFSDMLNQHGVEVFESTVRLIRELKAVGTLCGVVSSSKNCQRVLRIAGIEDLFLKRVDGVVSVELNLKGKPNPDIFLKCAELMKVEANKSVVVEDAISGVAAGRDGRFGLVIGIDRMDISERLRENGADVVIPDFLNVSPNDIDKWYFTKNKTSNEVSNGNLSD